MGSRHIIAKIDYNIKGGVDMIIDIDKLSSRDSFACIYKLNFPNGKAYVGQTNNIKRRMYEHNNVGKAVQPCDRAIAKYGRIRHVEILEQITDLTIMDEREQKYIKKYKTNNRKYGYNITVGGGQSHLCGHLNQRARLTIEEVLDIRNRRLIGCDKYEVYQDYRQLNFSTFERVWLGKTYQNIGMDIIQQCKEELSREEQISFRTRGERSSKSKLSETDVINIRQRFDNGERIIDISLDYPNVRTNTINRVCNRKTWTHI